MLCLSFSFHTVFNIFVQKYKSFLVLYYLSVIALCTTTMHYCIIIYYFYLLSAALRASVTNVVSFPCEYRLEFIVQITYETLTFQELYRS